jgi:hypothetical protein
MLFDARPGRDHKEAWTAGSMAIEFDLAEPRRSHEV